MEKSQKTFLDMLFVGLNELRGRLASGEISYDEYNKLSNELGQHIREANGMDLDGVSGDSGPEV